MYNMCPYSFYIAHNITVFLANPYETEKAGHGRALPLERAPAPGAARGESGSAQQHATAARGIEGHGEQSRQDLSANRDHV